MIIPRFEVRQTKKFNLTSYSALVLIGQCLEAAKVDAMIDPWLPVSQGMKTSDVVKAMIGLLSLGKSDFKAIEPFQTDRFFKEAPGMSKVPGSSWMRQRLDAKGAELRAGTHQSARESKYFYKRVFPRTKRMVKADQPVQMVEDSGFDSARLLFVKAEERDAWASEGRRLEFITKWNPRKQDKDAWITQAAGVFHETRPGKRVGLLDLQVELARKKQDLMYRAVKFVEHARRLILDFGRNFADHVKVFVALQERLLRAASP